MSNQKQRFPVGAIVCMLIAVPGYKHGDKVYGKLAKGAEGIVTGHTDDGRAMFDFYGSVHTFNETDGVIELTAVPNPLAQIKWRDARIAELETQLQQAQTSAADYMILLSANADLKAENERLTELLRGDRMVVATRINHELTTARRRNIELEAAINGCAGQWTPMPEGAHYCGCSEEDCPGEWRIENNGSRLVIGDGESELSVEFYEAIRVCWQVQP